MKNNNILFFLFMALLLSNACKRPDITPAFLVLSKEDFTNCIDVSNYNNTHEQNYNAKELEAIKQQSFTDVLVSLNGKELGYWQLPCTIPLKPDYSAQNYIRVIPCVRTINTTTTTLQYHFVTPIEQFFEMEKEMEYRLPNIQTTYVPSTDFPVLETFMQSTNFKARLASYPTIFKIDYDEYWDKDIGKITLSDTVVYFDVVTSYFPLLGKGERQFWEISYKSINGQMTTHLRFENTISGVTIRDMVILPSTQGAWKKAYIDITNTIMQVSNIASQVSTCLNISGIKEGQGDAEFYFENIKLITMDAPY